MIKDKISFISGISFIILCVILFYEASQLSVFGSVFPYAITSILFTLSILLIIRSCKLEIEVVNEHLNKVKIILLSITFFAWIYFLERTGFVLTSLIAFNLLVIINCEGKVPMKKVFFYMITGSLFVVLLYFGFKNLLLVPLPEGLWFRN